jgi:universal stress protein A
MKPLKSILVPIDFSACAIAALDFAVGLAARLDARIHVMNVVGVQTLGAEYGVPVTAEMADRVLESNEQELVELIAARSQLAAFGPPVLEVGDPRTQIEEQARALGADLIVMGTHGRRGVKRLVLGSVAESVLRAAPCPVLVVREEAQP